MAAPRKAVPQKQKVLAALLSAYPAGVHTAELERVAACKRVSARVQELKQDGWLLPDHAETDAEGMAIYRLLSPARAEPPDQVAGFRVVATRGPAGPGSAITVTASPYARTNTTDADVMQVLHEELAAAVRRIEDRLRPAVYVLPEPVEIWDLLG